ncbi:ECF transporter S component [Candidatus Clostridium stratigraminis]|uniref:ECF transporter S component n=1 Tax=Candidatus Clostridium stratigraminis TaxID=3381661 RepID=A0ABW8T2Q1_9CLOT
MNNNVSTVSAGRKLGTRQLTMIGMLSAISIVLGATGYGFIPLPMAKATILHIPVIIGAVLEGPIVGAMIGLLFGVFSLIQNYVAPSSALFFAFQNPLVSVLPRILIGIFSYYTYKYMFSKKELIKVGAAALIGTLTNTVGVLSMINLLYADHAAKALKVTSATVTKVIYGIALTNGIPEAIVAVIITVPVVMTLKKIRK